MNRLEPASTIIDMCGGVVAVAAMCGRSRTAVMRWRMPRDVKGTGGLVPTDAAQTLLSEATRRGINLTPDHFFPDYAPPVSAWQSVGDLAQRILRHAQIAERQE